MSRPTIDCDFILLRRPLPLLGDAGDQIPVADLAGRIATRRAQRDLSHRRHLIRNIRTGLGYLTLAVLFAWGAAGIEPGTVRTVAWICAILLGVLAAMLAGATYITWSFVRRMRRAEDTWAAIDDWIDAGYIERRWRPPTIRPTGTGQPAGVQP